MRMERVLRQLIEAENMVKNMSKNNGCQYFTSCQERGCTTTQGQENMGAHRGGKKTQSHSCLD